MTKLKVAFLSDASAEGGIGRLWQASLASGVSDSALRALVQITACALDEKYQIDMDIPQEHLAELKAAKMIHIEGEGLIHITQ